MARRGEAERDAGALKHAADAVLDATIRANRTRDEYAKSTEAATVAAAALATSKTAAGEAPRAAASPSARHQKPATTPDTGSLSTTTVTVK